MIIIDYSGIAISSVVAQKMKVEEDIIRHVILNSIRMYNKKYRNEYGQMVIACDSSSWRKEYFPNYKFKRKAAREEPSSIDWSEVFRIMSLIREELIENFPYKVVQVDRAEADDIIGVLSYETQEFGCHEPVMIVSADKDFIQLQKFSNVKQYSPMLKKNVVDPNPKQYLVEHIFKGDASDGIPNVLSPDNSFSEGIRQAPMTKKKMEVWSKSIDNLRSVMDSVTYSNYIRNKKLIDLTETPSDIKQNIINRFDEHKPAHKSKILNYLIKKRCKMLIDCVGDFY